MTGPGPDLAALLHAHPPGPLPDGFAARVDGAAVRLRARVRRRRLALTVSAVLAALAAGGVRLDASDQRLDGDVLRPAATAPADGDAGRAMPDLTGLDGPAAEQALAGYPQTVPRRYVASDSVPVGQLIAQSPEPGAPVSDSAPVVLTFSAGGPAVPLSDVPAEARAVLSGALGNGERVLVLRTAAGDGYKTDGMLTGPCPVTALLYRNLPFPDPVYDDRCYGAGAGRADTTGGTSGT